MCVQACGERAGCVCENALTLLGWGKIRRASGDRARGMSIRCGRGTLDGSSALIAGGFAAGASRPRRLCEPRHAWEPSSLGYHRDVVSLSSLPPLALYPSVTKLNSRTKLFPLSPTHRVTMERTQAWTPPGYQQPQPQPMAFPHIHGNGMVRCRGIPSPGTVIPSPF